MSTYTSSGQSSLEEDYLNITERFYKKQKNFTKWLHMYIYFCVAVTILYLYLFSNSIIQGQKTFNIVYNGIIFAIWLTLIFVNIRTYKRSKNTLEKSKRDYYTQLKKVYPQKYLIEQRSNKLKKLNNFKLFKKNDKL